MRVKKQELEPYMKQLTGPKLRKEYNEAIYCNCLFNLYAEYIMRNAGLNELQSGIKIAWRNINSLRHVDDTTLIVELNRHLTLPTKVHKVKIMVFPVVTFGCESWTVKKAEHQIINAFELLCWRRL